MIYLTMMACLESKTQKELEAAREIHNYHGIEEGASWTYRDDGADFDTGTAPPEESDIVLAKHNGDGYIELRRGARWIEGEPIGHLEFQVTETDFSLKSWELAGTSGNGSFMLSDVLPEDGEVFSSGDWECTAYRPDYLWTYYGYYDDLIIFDCSGSGLAGYYAFGKNVGLIRFESTSGYRLDLVAPW